MLDQEYYPEFYGEWLFSNERLTRFRKSREKIVGIIKGSELPSVQGTQYYENDLVVRYMVTSRNERL